MCKTANCYYFNDNNNVIIGGLAADYERFVENPKAPFRFEMPEPGFHHFLRNHDYHKTDIMVTTTTTIYFIKIIQYYRKRISLKEIIQKSMQSILELMSRRFVHGIAIQFDRHDEEK